MLEVGHNKFKPEVLEQLAAKEETFELEEQLLNGAQSKMVASEDRLVVRDLKSGNKLE